MSDRASAHLAPPHWLAPLREVFGSALQENVNLASYTTAHTGGAVDALLTVHNTAELEQAARLLWQAGAPFMVLGSGSNILVSDAGMRGVVVLNRARKITVDAESDPPGIWAESGANFGMVARKAAISGLSGMEWAATIPGTLGGAVYGNAGAYGGDINSILAVANILHPQGKEAWTADRLGYAYRSSALKRADRSSTIPSAVILSAYLRLSRSDPQTVQAQMDRNAEHRRRTQPPGASMGSMFKNPPGDYAGRLIEAAGLKGLRIGDAEISPVHGNFFINHGQAAASDIWQLIQQVIATVDEKFGVRLELEVELVGDWPAVQNFAPGAKSI